MKMARRWRWIAGAVLAGLILGPGGLPWGTTGAVAAGPIVLTGAGATFPYPIYSRWFAEYNRLHPDVRINYQSIGSGGGIAQVQKGTVDFGASDAPLSDDQLKAMGRPVALIPTVAGSIAMSYNVPGVGSGLRLTPENIADLYMGQITKWNDPRLAANNPSVKLPNLPVTIVHRSDGSGTTFHFTSFLSIVSRGWADKVGRSTSVEWPTGIGGKGNEGVSGLVKQTPGGIGYVELAYVVQNQLTYAVVRNRSGAWIAPSLSATTAAAAGGADAMVKTNDVRVSIAYSPGATTYPIAGFTYLLIPKEQTDESKGKALTDFLWWAIHDGEKDAPQLLYAPLPAPVVLIDERIIKTIGYQGHAFLPAP
ncbi:MAG TPA: phosphate ABC transporter substrate-binding protein PstS [bacterium]|nr:phosphate ABC transporter substrate-binding protein PstS [bacterium]